MDIRGGFQEWRRQTVGRLTSTVFSAFSRYIFGTITDEVNAESIVSFTLTPKRMTLNAVCFYASMLSWGDCSFRSKLRTN